MMPTQSTDERFLLACSLVFETGKFLLERFKSIHELSYVSDPTNLAAFSQTQIEVENRIKNGVLKPYNLDLWNGFSKVAENTIQSGWFLIPIDGEINFRRGISIFCITLAYFHEGKPEFVIVYDPVADELILARKNRGVTINGKPICANLVHAPSDSLVSLDLDNEFPIETWIELNRSFRDQQIKVSRLNCTSLGFAYVATGRIEAHYEWSRVPPLLSMRKIWYQAMNLFILEAKGQYSHLIIEKQTYSWSLATNSALHDTLKRMLSSGGLGQTDN